MSRDVIRWGDGLLPSPRVERALGRISNDTTVAVATAQAKAEIESAKISAIGVVGTMAMHDVALISQVEQSLATAVPHASGRLATVADILAIGLAGQVSRSVVRIGGC